MIRRTKWAKKSAAPWDAEGPKVIDQYRRSFQDSDWMKDLMEAVAQNTELF